MRTPTAWDRWRASSGPQATRGEVPGCGSGGLGGEFGFRASGQGRMGSSGGVGWDRVGSRSSLAPARGSSGRPAGRVVGGAGSFPAPCPFLLGICFVPSLSHPSNNNKCFACFPCPPPPPPPPKKKQTNKQTNAHRLGLLLRPQPPPTHPGPSRRPRPPPPPPPPPPPSTPGTRQPRRPRPRWSASTLVAAEARAVSATSARETATPTRNVPESSFATGG